MAINKNALIRYKTLDQCFSNPYKQFFIEDLIEACNDVLTDHYGYECTVSRRQIFSDIDFMKSNAGYDAPIHCIKIGRRGYYRYEVPDFSILKKPLTNEEQKSIENTLELLSRMKGIPGLEGLGSLETKLLDTSNTAPHDKIISFEENEFLVGAEYLTPLYNFIKNKQAISIKYKSFRLEQVQEFVISPYHLKQYNKRWFLFGKNHQTLELQNLALDRIQSIDLINTIYEANDIDFDEYFDDIIGVSNNLNLDLQKIRIKLTDHIIPYITSKPLHGSQKIVDNILTLELKLNYELESLILSYGENMKVLEPLVLKENIANRLKKATQFY